MTSRCTKPYESISSDRRIHRVEHFDAGHAAFLEDTDRFAASFAKFAGALGI